MMCCAGLLNHKRPPWYYTIVTKPLRPARIEHSCFALRKLLCSAADHAVNDIANKDNDDVYVLNVEMRRLICSATNTPSVTQKSDRLE